MKYQRKNTPVDAVQFYRGCNYNNLVRYCMKRNIMTFEADTMRDTFPIKFYGREVFYLQQGMWLVSDDLNVTGFYTDDYFHKYFQKAPSVVGDFHKFRWPEDPRALSVIRKIQYRDHAVL